MQGLWITQDKNGELLTEAFETCKNVILFYSVNNSKAIQGYVCVAGLGPSCFRC